MCLRGELGEKRRFALIWDEDGGTRTTRRARREREKGEGFQCSQATVRPCGIEKGRGTTNALARFLIISRRG